MKIKENTDQNLNCSQYRNIDFQENNYNKVINAETEVCSLHSVGTEEKVTAVIRFQVWLEMSGVQARC